MTPRTRAWTLKERRKVRLLHAEGLSQKDIADALGRNVGSLTHQLRVLGLTKRKTSAKPLDLEEPPVYLTIDETRRLMRRVGKTIEYGWQSELARAAGCSASVINQFDAGYTTPGDRLLTVLGLRRVVLYEVIGDPVTLEKTPRRVQRSAQQSDWDMKPVVPAPNAIAGRTTTHRMEG